MALIEDIDSEGAGVVLSRDGLIITNHHVVASGISMSVTLDVKERGEVQTKRFDDVEVWKVHPEYDLALLKVSLPGGVFAAARRLPEGEELRTGSSCYAIGNPGGGDVSLVKSITEGLVSSASRTVDGLDYIQTSAALNPGNSGGALADDRGRVIGIATWKLDGADNIGFAIPLSSVDLDEFIPPSKREPDFAQAKRFQDEAERYANLSLGLEGDERVLAIQLAAFYYRQCLQAVPNDPAPYNNLGAMYFRLKEDKLAKKYLEAALKIRPLYASSLSMLGIIFERSEKKPEAAMAAWFKGVEDNASADDASACAENLAISYFNRKNYSRAAYSIRWANVLADPDPGRLATRRAIWEQSANQLSEKQFTALKNKTSDFSREDLEAFGSGQATAATTTKPNGNDAPPTAPTSLGTGSEVSRKFLADARKRLEDAVELPLKGLTKPLPSEPSEIITGYAGTCLIMRFPELNRLGVFDLAQAKITHYVPLADKSAVVAAGGKVLLIYYPEPNRLELWDMETWTKKKEVTLRSDLRFSALAMGLHCHRFAVGVRPEGNAHTGERVALLSIPDGKVIPSEFVQSDKGMALIHFFGHLGESARVFVEQNGTSALVLGAGAGYLNLAKPSEIEVTYDHGSGRHSRGAWLVPGGAHYVIGGVDAFAIDKDAPRLLYEADKKSEQSVRRLQCSGVEGFRGVAEIIQVDRGDPMLRLRELPRLNVKFSLPIDESMHRTISRSSETSMHASAFVKRCAVIAKKDKKVFLFPMDQAADATSTGPVAPGADFVRKLSFEKGSKVRIDSAPANLSYDSEEQVIRWKIPAEQPRGSEVSVIFHITDPNGEESLSHREDRDSLTRQAPR